MPSTSVVRCCLQLEIEVESRCIGRGNCGGVCLQCLEVRLELIHFLSPSITNPGIWSLLAAGRPGNRGVIPGLPAGDSLFWGKERISVGGQPASSMTPGLANRDINILSPLATPVTTLGKVLPLAVGPETIEAL